jgi:hypothetical protein
MPIPNSRPSLTTTLDQRYAQQHAGGTFEVKEVLGDPGETPSTGKVIDAVSQQGAANQNPNGFQVKVLQQVSQLKVVQMGGVSNDYSLYIHGLDTTRYHS